MTSARRPVLVVFTEEDRWSSFRQVVTSLVPRDLTEILLVGRDSSGFPDIAERYPERDSPGAERARSSHGEPAVLILADQPVAPDQIRAILAAAGYRGEKRSFITRIGLGTASKGHVVLPADVSPQVLATLLTLASNVLRLRAKIAKRRSVLRRLKRAAFHDALTGLFNRRAWPKLFDHAWQKAQHTGGQLVFALFDLDQFRSVNEALGHTEGDAVLRAMAQTARQACRREDFLIRWGGDEIAFLCVIEADAIPDTVVDRVRRRLAMKAPWLASGEITATAGLCALRPQAVKMSRAQIGQKMLEAADRALRQAKSMGGNTLLRSDPPLDAL